MRRNKILKKGVKYLTYLILFLLVISVASLLYLTSFRVVVFDENVYTGEFEKHKIYEKFPDSDIDKINSNLLNYFRYEEKNIPIESDFFNEKEKTHLMDVKLIIRAVLFALYSGILVFALKFLVLALLVRYQKEDLLNYLFFIITAGGILTVISTLLILLIMKINFDFIFTLFHLMTFKNNLWILNPATDNLIVMYPEGFFYDMAIRIILIALILAIALLVTGIYAYRIRKRFKNK